MSKQKENGNGLHKKIDGQIQGSEENIATEDDVTKRETVNSGNSKDKIENLEEGRQKNSRDWKLDKGRLSSSSEKEKRSPKADHSVHSRASVKRASTSKQNHSAQPGSREARELKDKLSDGNVRKHTGIAHTDHETTPMENTSAYSTNGMVHTGSRTVCTGTGTAHTENGYVGSSSKRTTPGVSLNRYTFDWSNFTYKTTEQDETKRPRVVLATGPEPCSCYPVTSKKTVSSMIYDEIRCVHCNNIGLTHASVVRFDDGWYNTSATPKENIFQIRSKSLFKGYPRPAFSHFVCDDVSSNSITEVNDADSQNDDLSILTSASKIYLKGNNSPDSKPPSISDIPFRIPRLGYTPQSVLSHQCEDLSNNLNKHQNYGNLLGSNSKSKISDESSIVSEQSGAPKVFNTVRTFKGKYFDNGKCE